MERAALQNDPEGLYNMGVMHLNGEAGLAKNATKVRAAQRYPDSPLARSALPHSQSHA